MYITDVCLILRLSGIPVFISYPHASIIVSYNNLVVLVIIFNEELHNLYSSPNIIRQVKANEVGGACGTHGRGECTRLWWESPKERDHLKDQGVDGKMGSERILGRLAWEVWIGFDWLRTGTGGGLLGVRFFGFLSHGVS
jgi:hypothetical protein